MTKYGLGGLCELHIDPYGIHETGTENLPKSRQYLKSTGDMIGTFMAWIHNVEAGGSTIFSNPGFEGS